MEREIRLVLNAVAVAFPAFFCVPFHVCVLAERYVPSVPEDRGGADRLSEGQRQMARRITSLAVEAEVMEAARAEGGELDLDAYVALTNALGRALARLGLGRKARDVTPSLPEIIAGRAG